MIVGNFPLRIKKHMRSYRWEGFHDYAEEVNVEKLSFNLGFSRVRVKLAPLDYHNLTGGS